MPYAEVQHIVGSECKFGVALVYRFDVDVGGQLVAEGCAAEEVGVGEVDSGVVEGVEAFVTQEVLVLCHSAGKDGVVASDHGGKTYGITLVDAGEPFTHTYLCFVAQDAAHNNHVALGIVDDLLVVVACSGSLAGEEHIGAPPGAEV